MAALLLVQLLAGVWTLSLMSFFPIYLEEQLRYAPVAIAGMVAVGQASGMFAALLGGGLSDTLGSKWVLVLGLLGGVVASLIFQSGVPLMVAVLWGLVGAAGSLQTLGGSSYLTRMADPRRLGLLAARMRSAARWAARSAVPRRAVSWTPPGIALTGWLAWVRSPHGSAGCDPVAQSTAAAA